jgi:methylmalonyl-CoA mutase
MKTKLDFNEFPPSTFEDWKGQVVKELKDKPYESLDWEIEDGWKTPPYLKSYNAKFPRISRIQKDWEIGQVISFTTEKETNQHILSSLNLGVNALFIQFEQSQKISWDVLLEGVFLEYITIHFKGKGVENSMIRTFIEFLKHKTDEIEKTSGSFDSPSIEKISKDEIQEREQFFGELEGKWQVFTVHADKIHNKGGSIIQSLGYALSEGNETLHRIISEASTTIDKASAMVRFQFATSSSYFPEIAKYKAFRFLWSEVVNAYQPVHECSVNTKIDGFGSLYLQAAADQHNNMLRSTTQAMSAIVGDVDTVVPLAFDQFSNHPSSESNRWASNILHLLREESYLSELSNATDGAYYIEQLIDSLCSNAWKLFQELESNGGISQAWELFNSKMMEFRNSQIEKVKSGEIPILGVNKYPNKKEIIDSKVLNEGVQERLSFIIEKEMEDKK